MCLLQPACEQCTVKDTGNKFPVQPSTALEIMQYLYRIIVFTLQGIYRDAIPLSLTNIEEPNCQVLTDQQTQLPWPGWPGTRSAGRPDTVALTVPFAPTAHIPEIQSHTSNRAIDLSSLIVLLSSRTCLCTCLISVECVTSNVLASDADALLSAESVSSNEHAFDTDVFLSVDSGLHPN